MFYSCFYYNYDVYFSDLISGKLKVKRLPIDHKLRIIDDRKECKSHDLKKAISEINKKFPKERFIRFKDLLSDSYEELLDIVRKSDKYSIEVQGLRDVNGNKLYGYNREDSNLPLAINIKEDEIADVPLECYDRFQDQFIFYDNSILSDEEFKMGIRIVGDQIDKFAENDVQKVLLLDKLLRENVLFDEEYHNKGKDVKFVDKLNHKSHKVQSIFTDRCAVGNAIATFALMVLSYLNIECKRVGDKYIDGHMWNEIKLDGKWYSNDFAYSLWLDRENGTEYTLVKCPSSDHIKGEGNFDHCNTYDRKMLESELYKIKDTHIVMPSVDLLSSTTAKYCDSEIKKPSFTKIKISLR